MKVTLINDGQFHLESSSQEINVVNKIFAEVKKYLNHEPEFQTRVNIYYAEAEEIMSLLNDNCVLSLRKITLIKNILNEACNGIYIKDFESKIGVPEEEARLYLKILSKAIKDFRSNQS